MSQAEFQAVTRLVLGCEFLARPVCFLVLWKAFFPAVRDRKDLAAAGILVLTHVVWWFTSPGVSLWILFAGLVLLYCHIRYRGLYERAVFLVLLYQHLWAQGLLLSVCVQEYLDSRLMDLVADPERFREEMVPMIYTTFIRNRILSGVVFFLALLLLTVLVLRFVKIPFEPGWQDTVFLSVFNIVGYLFIRMIIEITNVKVDREVFNLFTQRRDWLYKAPLMGVLLYAGELSALCIWQRLKALQEERQQHFVREQQAEAIQKRMDEAERFYDSIRRVHHEMRNHLANIRGLAAKENYPELEDYLEELDETFEEPGYRYLTGNAVTDVIINDRYQKAVRAGISFQSDFAWDGSDAVSVFDLGIILGNLLDNALEACERLKGEDRYVRLTLSRRDPFLLIRVENRFDGKVIRKEGGILPESLKNTSVSGHSPEHGLGLKNVQKIAERYLGGVDIRTENGIFQVTVMLQQKEAVRP